MALREFLLRIVGDVSGAQKEIGKLDKSVGGFKDTLVTAGAVVAGVFTVQAVGNFSRAIVDAASDQEQAIGSANSVFKEYAGDIQDFSKTTAESLGISRAQFLQLSSVTGALLKNAGAPLDEVAKSTTELTERAADMAAMFGGDVSQALEAINSGLKGELDPLEKYGVSLKASAVDAKAVAMGYVDQAGKATDYGKTMARIALIMEQSADAQGTAAREADTFAGSTQRLKAQMTDLQADIGNKLLPVVVKLAEVLRGLVGFIVANQGWLFPLVAGIGAIVVGMKAWTLATEAWTIATNIAKAAQIAFNIAVAANPIGLIVIAIVAVIGALVLAYMKVDWFRDAVDTAIDAIVGAFNWFLDVVKGVFKWISDYWQILLIILTGPFGIAVVAIVKNFDRIVQAAREAIGWITDIVSAVWRIIGGPFEAAARVVISAWEPIKDFFAAVPGFIRDVFTGLGDIISYPFRIAFNAIKGFWNSTVGGFGFSIPTWIPDIGGKSFKIPRMALGGIVTRPTVALIGEAGPEAVVPLGRNGGFGNVTIIVNALAVTPETGRIIYESLAEYQRTSGRG